MYSRPSSSVMRAPRPSRTNTGTPPTAPNARTGEFTPPGMSCRERSNSARLRSYIGGPRRGIEKARERKGCGAYVGCFVERGNHREHVGAGIDHARRVRRRDAADGRDRQSTRGLRARDRFERRMRRAGLRGGREDAPDGDVVGAGGGGMARLLWIRVAGDADHAVRHARARLAWVRVFAAEVDAARAGGERELDRVVDDEEGAGTRAFAREAARLLQRERGGERLRAVLHDARARLEAKPRARDEAFGLRALRRDRVEAAQARLLTCHRRPRSPAPRTGGRAGIGPCPGETRGRARARYSPAPRRPRRRCPGRARGSPRAPRRACSRSRDSCPEGAATSRSARCRRGGRACSPPRAWRRASPSRGRTRSRCRAAPARTPRGSRDRLPPRARAGEARECWA